MSAPLPLADPPRVVPSERVGYAYMVASAVGFALMGLLVKFATETLPFHEVAFFRAFVGVVITLVAALLFGVPLVFREARFLLTRGVMGWASLMTAFLAISGMHVADASLLLQTSPFFTALLAALVLGEHVGRRTWACLAAATVGVACVIGPQGGFWNWYAVAALASALCASVAYMAVKKANAANPPLIIAASFSVVASALTLPFMLADYHAPTPTGWALLLGAGTAGTLAQIAMTYGYRYARASTASIFSLLNPLLTAVGGVAMFGMTPTWGTFVGGAILLGSGAALFMEPAAPRLEAAAPADKALAKF